MAKATKPPAHLDTSRVPLVGGTRRFHVTKATAGPAFAFSAGYIGRAPGNLTYEAALALVAAGSAEWIDDRPDWWDPVLDW